MEALVFDIAPVREEYERCLKLFQDPTLAPPLYGVWGFDEVRKYYGHRAEGLGFALDTYERFERSVSMAQTYGRG